MEEGRKKKKKPTPRFYLAEGVTLVAVWRVSGRCVKGVLRVSGGYQWDAIMVIF